MGSPSFADTGVAIHRGLLTTAATLLDGVRAAHDTRWPTQDRVLDGWRRDPRVRALATHPAVLDAVESVYGRSPIPFQTLNFRRGTGQPLHADLIHFDSVPTGWVCAAWVALEDIDDDQGPVEYVPGSHLEDFSRVHLAERTGRFDNARYEDAVARHVGDRPRARFTASAGDVLIWHGALLHGGAPVVDPASTRWSQVTHYFLDGFAYVTPQRSPAGSDDFFVRDPLVDISTGRPVGHTLDGAPARLWRRAHDRTTLLRAADPPPPVPARVASTVRGARRRVAWWTEPARDALRDHLRGRRARG